VWALGLVFQVGLVSKGQEGMLRRRRAVAWRQDVVQVSEVACQAADGQVT